MTRERVGARLRAPAARGRENPPLAPGTRQKRAQRDVAPPAGGPRNAGSPGDAGGGNERVYPVVRDIPDDVLATALVLADIYIGAVAEPDARIIAKRAEMQREWRRRYPE